MFRKLIEKYKIYKEEKKQYKLYCELLNSDMDPKEKMKEMVKHGFWQIIDRSIKVPIKTDIDELPKYETKGSAGMDVKSIEDDYELKSGERKLFNTGIKVAIPKGFYISVHPRSGLALKHGITVLNTPGTIDSDYRGNIGIILINLSQDPYLVKKGDKIAQLLLHKIESIKWESVEELSETDRGEGGFGSTTK